MNLFRLPRLSLAVWLCLCLTWLGCQRQNAVMAPPPVVEVSAVPVGTETVELTTELPGRISPVREAQVRARATGILLKRRFEEGSMVREGQLLFEIDPAPLQAALESARAMLARANAAANESKARVGRYAELIKIDAISRQVYDESTAALGQNEADVLAATAAVHTAELNLGYIQVTAPIAGRIGKSLVTEGALVSAAEATQLAVIRQLDPVYFDFTQSSTEVLRLRRSMERGEIQARAGAKDNLQLILEDGSLYGHPGKWLFSDIGIDATTGMVSLRAEVPNPENLLLPGMFTRGRVIEGVRTNALVIPQRTVTRGAAGAASVLVINSEDTVEIRTIEIERILGNRVIVARGLRAGERIVVEGSQKAPPGAKVRVIPYRNAVIPEPVASH